MKNKQIAVDIYNIIENKQNIQSVAHCMTRLRIDFKNIEEIDESVFASVKGVIGTQLVENQLQLIIGMNDVDEVYQYFIELAGVTKLEKLEEDLDGSEKKTKKTIGSICGNAITALADIFIPLIPLLIASGLITGIAGLFIYPGYFSETQSLIEIYPKLDGIANILQLFSDSILLFLPPLVGYTAAKRFGGDPLLGVAMGVIMCNPNLADPVSSQLSDVGSWNFFGLEISKVGYQSTVLPILAASYMVVKFEAFFKSKLPKLFKILSAGFAIMVAGLITFVLVGPIVRDLSIWFGYAIVNLYETTGLFGAAVFGFLYAPSVVTGMHHTFIPIQIQILADSGQNFILPIGAMSNVAVGGSALGVWFLSKSADYKAESGFAGVLSIMGTSEPALFGVNLRFKHVFLSALIASSIGAMIMSYFNVTSTGIGAGGVMGYLLYTPENLLPYTIGMAVTIAIAFTLTVISSKMLNKDNFESE